MSRKGKSMQREFISDNLLLGLRVGMKSVYKCIPEISVRGWKFSKCGDACITANLLKNIELYTLNECIFWFQERWSNCTTLCLSQWVEL